MTYNSCPLHYAACPTGLELEKTLGEEEEGEILWDTAGGRLNREESA